MTGTTIETEEFKMTEIRLLPSEWEVARLGNVIDVIRNGTTKKQNRSGRGYPISRIETISASIINPAKTGFVEGLSAEDTKIYRLKQGDILLSHINSEPYLGNSALYRGNPPILIHGMNLLLIRTDPVVLNSEFLNFLFNFYRSKGIFIGIASRAVNQSSINQGKIKTILVPLPPLPEQEKIAYVLSTVQAAIEKTEAVIRTTRELKKSLMKYLFTYGPVSIAEAENVTLRETEIGLVPEDWEVVRLEKVCELRKEAVEPTNKGLRYIGLEHMDSGETRVNRFGSEDEVRSTKNRFYEGDILYGKLRPYLDKVAIMNFDGICSTDIIVITTSSNRVSADYLVNLLHLPSFLSFATSTMTGVNHPRTSWKALTPFMIPLPSIVTQKRIAETLFTIDQKIEAGENQKRALEALFKTLLSNLMTGKIRVNSLEVPV